MAAVEIKSKYLTCHYVLAHLINHNYFDVPFYVCLTLKLENLPKTMEKTAQLNISPIETHLLLSFVIEIHTFKLKQDA